ncbi:amidohydrolase family protein [Gordonia amarae]|nr:amidohydrolase [Gordonia amarae]MCS3879308.1 putative amidohydrolase YtcJ [Gordonia amarae]QHN17796.1 amidohydrolase family protein [Gordonia amarae]QHN22327.1 amidohydrolase family protein [Gordonia amarae]QHN31203.1 amidohydrolase family protein [Gordonia amarae]QHN39948.1 amidohydrolase family protein [Gordonia amarae]
MAADHVFTNAAVWQPETASPADTVAVTDGVISAIRMGVDTDLVGPGTQVHDLGGAGLLPGFIDAHVHPVAGGLAALRCDLSELAHDRRGYLDAIAEYVRTHPDEPVISGSGWYGDAFPGGLPTKDDLDSVVGDRPVVLSSHDGHGVWSNSEALRRAGISAATPDPDGGRIERDERGEPTGVLFERAFDAVNALIPADGPDRLRDALLLAQQRLLSVGVTGWQDAGVGIPAFGLTDTLDTYLAADAAGELVAHVCGALWWTAEEGIGQLGTILDRRDSARGPRLHIDTVKVMQDGICENCTAAMLEPYCNIPADAHSEGLSFIDPVELADVCALLARNDFHIHMHAVGDRAVRECLDALSSAVTACGDFAAHHQIAHLDVVDPLDMPRFRELGVTANIQALWARRDIEIVERKLPLLGPEREGRHFPFGSLLRAGAQLAMGSDWPVTDPNPLWALHTAVHRTGSRADPHAIGPDARTVPLLADEAISLRSAVDAYTAGAARVTHRAARAGTIEVGKDADLIVLDGDITTADDIGELAVQTTMVGGAVVYERP